MSNLDDSELIDAFGKAFYPFAVPGDTLTLYAGEVEVTGSDMREVMKKFIEARKAQAVAQKLKR